MYLINEEKITPPHFIPVVTSFLCLRSTHRLPWWLRWWSVCLQCGRPRLHPWVGKIPWRRKWQPTPVLLPGKSHKHSTQGRKRVRKAEQLHIHSVQGGVSLTALVAFLKLPIPSASSPLCTTYLIVPGKMHSTWSAYVQHWCELKQCNVREDY